GVVVVATKDSVNSVTNRIADLALKAMLATREGRPLPQPERTTPIRGEDAKRLAGHYVNGDKWIELTESAGNLSMLTSEGGSPLRLRVLGDGYITDDRLGFGISLRVRDGKLLLGNETYTRIADEKPKPAPENLRGLIGEYGYDHDILYILEKDGKLWALIEWYEYDPLEQVSDTVFKFPNHGLYDGAKLVFKRDAKGHATQVEAAGIVFKRRQIEPEEGASQLRVKPLRPVAELLKEAMQSQPPKEQGDFRKPELVELTKLDPTIKLEVRYATTNNFLGSFFYKEARAFLQRPAAEALVRAHQKLKTMGYGLLIHDGYRPWFVTKVFWDATPDDKKI